MNKDLQGSTSHALQKNEEAFQESTQDPAKIIQTFLVSKGFTGVIRDYANDKTDKSGNHIWCLSIYATEHGKNSVLVCTIDCCKSSIQLRNYIIHRERKFDPDREGFYQFDLAHPKSLNQIEEALKEELKKYDDFVYLYRKLGKYFDSHQLRELSRYYYNIPIHQGFWKFSYNQEAPQHSDYKSNGDEIIVATSDK